MSENDDISREIYRKSPEEIEKYMCKIESLIPYFINNDLETCSKALSGEEHPCYINYLALGSIHGLTAIQTFDKDHIQLAKYTFWKGIEEVNKHRKPISLIFSTDFNTFTEDECVAELLNTHLNSMYGCLCTIGDQSLMGLIKAAYRLRTAYVSVRNCEKILKGKTNWKNDYIKREFESSINLSLGGFEMALSYCPRTLVHLLEYAGFKTDRSNGLENIIKSATIEDSKFHHYMSKLSIFAYYFLGENFFGLGEPNKKLLDYVANHFIPKTTKGSNYYNIVHGFRNHVDCEFEKANEYYDKYYISKTPTIEAVKYVVVWSNTWSLCLTGDWNGALIKAKYLKDNCNWSRALFTYVYASIAYMVLKEKYDPKLYESMIESFEKVPKLKRNFGGKKAFHEKLVVLRSKLFVSNPKAILMPHFDLFYLMNIVRIAGSRRDLLEKIVDQINSTYEDEKEAGTLDDDDAKCYLIFMKAYCYTSFGEDKFAIDLLNQILNNENDLQYNTHLIPQAYYELGMIYRKKGDTEKAKKNFKRAKSYSGYLTETMIHFRSDTALGSLDTDLY